MWKVEVEIMKLKVIRKETVQLIRKELNKLLEEYGTPKGLQIELGNNLSYSDSTISGKIKVILIGDGSVKDMYKKEFIENAEAWGLKPSYFGRSFISNGKTYKIVAIQVRKHKYPVLTQDTNGKMVCYTIESINRLMS